MVSKRLQILGISLGFIGFLMVIVVCALPMWKVTSFIGPNIITAQTIWQGMWMNCVVQSTGQMQCKVYDSMMVLPQDLQAARAMTVISILTGLCGALLSVVGGKCTTFIEDKRSKAKTCILAGVLLIVSGLLCLIPVSWSANTIISNFYNPLVIEAQRYELGASLYIGWAATALLLMGGGLLCWNCQPKHEHPI
uniref:claudin-4-like n=1 Tax=Monopterus albus TaxID=43700 RepID=UPI0009B367A6|nr:claudin-4-like [Monopterus albus]